MKILQSPVVIGVLVFALAFGATAYRLDLSPDLHIGEIIYTRLGIRAGGELALVWDSGEPFLVHPPLYFIALGLTQAAIANPEAVIDQAGDIFLAVANARFLNAFLAALTALFLFWFGWFTGRLPIALLLPALFILDPIAFRTNRRASLETLAMLLTLAGFAILLLAREDRPLNWRRCYAAGFVLGLAILTDEMVFPSLVAIFVFAVIEGMISHSGHYSPSRTALPPLITLGVALLTYGVYPVWALVQGNWTSFSAEKWLGMQRLLGLAPPTGWNYAGIPFTDYGTTYLLLALGVAGTLVILILALHTRFGRLLAAWGVVLYAVYSLLALTGGAIDRFFYLLLVPAILLFGTGVSILIDLFQSSQAAQFDAYSRQIPSAPVIVSAILLVFLPINLLHWTEYYGLGADNAYAQLTSFVNRQLPPSAPINASGDLATFLYLFPDRPVTDVVTPQEAQAEGVHYFTLITSHFDAHSARVDPELINWILARGEALFAARSDSYGGIFLYRLDYDAPATPVPVETGSRLSFRPARSGFISQFLLMLLLWSGGLYCAAEAASRLVPVAAILSMLLARLRLPGGEWDSESASPAQRDKA